MRSFIAVAPIRESGAFENVEDVVRRAPLLDPASTVREDPGSDADRCFFALASWRVTSSLSRPPFEVSGSAFEARAHTAS